MCIAVSSISECIVRIDVICAHSCVTCSLFPIVLSVRILLIDKDYIHRNACAFGAPKLMIFLSFCY